MPGKADFRPSFEFTIKDTTSLYRIFLVLRHNEKYSFSNIYVNLYVNRAWSGFHPADPARPHPCHQRKRMAGQRYGRYI
jgi:hypothetical protein